MSGLARLFSGLLAASVGFAFAGGARAARDRLDPGSLFSSPGIEQVFVSPSGQWIVARGQHSGQKGILVRRRGEEGVSAVYRSASPVESIAWIDDDTLLVEPAPGSFFGAVALRLEWDDGAVVHDRLDVRKPGRLVDPLTHEPGVLLWGSATTRTSTVERRRVDSLGRWAHSDERQTGEIEVVAELRERVIRWITDRHGVVRAALALEGREDPELSIHYRAGQDKRWREVWRGFLREEEEVINPVAMAADDEHLVVVAHGGRDTRGLYTFDPRARALGSALFQHPGVDVKDVLFDSSRTEVIAAVYDEGGDEHYFYFDEYRDAHLPEFGALGLGRDVMLVGSSRDDRVLLLLVRSARNPGCFYLLDQESGELTKVGEVNLEVRPEWLVDTQTRLVETEDGTTIETFLTRPEPRDPRPPPLFVLPHGGPVGIHDDRSFDPLTQFIAAAGIAVLKVNYRGSGGYGREFERAGAREWGEGIEDDIDAAVQSVIDAKLVDPERVCIGGASYGGYSALMSAIRRPDRYRCVASIAGVTDIPLMFTASDFSASKFLRERFGEIVGDLETDYERLAASSPVYRVDELEAPVLIIHGTKDRRVDPEHAHRLRAMLRLYGKPYEWFEVAGAGHGFNRQQWHRIAWLLRRFLKRHLEGGGPRAAQMS